MDNETVAQESKPAPKKQDAEMIAAVRAKLLDPNISTRQFTKLSQVLCALTGTELKRTLKYQGVKRKKPRPPEPEKPVQQEEEPPVGESLIPQGSLADTFQGTQRAEFEALLRNEHDRLSACRKKYAGEPLTPDEERLVAEQEAIEQRIREAQAEDAQRRRDRLEPRHVDWGSRPDTGGILTPEDTKKF